MATASEFVYTIKAEYAGSTDMRRLSDDLNKISQIKSFEKLSGDIAKTEKALEEAKKKADELRSTMEKTGTATATNAFSKAESSVSKLTSSLERQKAELAGYDASLKKAGISATELAAAQAKLSASSYSKGNLLASEQLLGVRSFSTIKAEIASLNTAYNTLAASGTRSMKELAVAQEALKAKTRLLQAEMVAGNSRVTASAGLMSGAFGKIFVAAAALGFAANLVKIADQYTNINARLKLATSSTAEFESVQKSLFRTSQETGTSYETNAAAFSKLALAMKSANASSAEVLKINELVNKSLIVNGSATAEASAFILQFGQAMGSGVLQGDEFRSMMENNGYFAGMLAKALDTNIAGLRKMSKEGKLTSDVLRAAFPKMATEINAAFEKMPVTVGRSMEMLKNSFGRVLDEGNKAGQGTATFSGEIAKLSKKIDENAPKISKFFGELTKGAIYMAEQTAGAFDHVGNVIAMTSLVATGNAPLEMLTMSVKDFKKELDTVPTSVKKQIPAHEEVAAKTGPIYKAVTDEIKKQYETLADSVKRILDEISGKEKDLSAELREMGRSGMSGLGAWVDRKNEAEELAVAAKAAAEEADKLTKAGQGAAANEKWKEAVTLAEESKKAFKDLNTEVSEGDQLQISKAEALKVAMAGVKTSGELAIDILKQQRQYTIEAGQALNEMTGGELAKQLPDAAKKFEDITNKAKDLTDESKKFNDAWQAAWDGALVGGISAIDELERRLQDLTKDRTVTIHVKEESGGGASYDGYARGGNPFFGGLRGYGGGDRRLILVEDGEHVIRKEAVRQMGHDYFQRFNVGNFSKMPSINLSPQIYGKFAEGGPIGSGGSSIGGDTYNLSVQFPSNAASLSQRDMDRMAGQLMQSLQRMYNRRS
jgi:tape measure domain-containing protein